MPPTRLVYPHYTGCQILSTQGGPDNNYVIIKGLRWTFTQSRVYLGGRCVHRFCFRSFQVLQLVFKIPAFKSELSHRVLHNATQFVVTPSGNIVNQCIYRAFTCIFIQSGQS